MAFHSKVNLLKDYLYHVERQELLTVVKALENWHRYLRGAISLAMVTGHNTNINIARDLKFLLCALLLERERMSAVRA